MIWIDWWCSEVFVVGTREWLMVWNWDVYEMDVLSMMERNGVV